MLFNFIPSPLLTAWLVKLPYLIMRPFQNLFCSKKFKNRLILNDLNEPRLEEKDYVKQKINVTLKRIFLQKAKANLPHLFRPRKKQDFTTNWIKLTQSCSLRSKSVILGNLFDQTVRFLFLIAVSFEYRKFWLFCLILTYVKSYFLYLCVPYWRVGSAIVFNIESLVDFILASGDFSDPETRLPFSDKDLAEIDEIVRYSEDSSVFCALTQSW